MITKLLYFLAMLITKIFLIKQEDKIAKNLIVVEKNTINILIYFVLLIFCVIFFYKTLEFYSDDYIDLIIIYLYNNLVTVLMMKYFLLKIYYCYYDETIKFGNLSLQRLRDKAKKKFVLFLFYLDKNFNTKFIGFSLKEKYRKFIIHLISFIILATCGLNVYIFSYFIYSVVYFYVFIMEDRNDGLLNNTFFREEISMNSEGKKKLMDYCKYLINTNKEMPKINLYKDFEYFYK